MRGRSFDDHTLCDVFVEDWVAFGDVDGLADVVGALAGAFPIAGDVWSLDDVVRDELSPEWADHCACFVFGDFSSFAVGGGDEEGRNKDLERNKEIKCCTFDVTRVSCCVTFIVIPSSSDEELIPTSDPAIAIQQHVPPHHTTPPAPPTTISRRPQPLQQQEQNLLWSLSAIRYIEH